MYETISDLKHDTEYGALFRYFCDLTRIPRPSYHEKAVSDYLVEFAKEHGLEYYQDSLYNVIMIREASKGREQDEPIILQGHMDMVCEKTTHCAKNMEEDGLDVYVDRGYLRAKDTSLGGDDGAAVAIALAILADERLNHPRIEFVCTTCEEVGLDGAKGIDLSPLKGRRLLNIDHEREGQFLAGCAGGGVETICLDLKPKNQYYGRAVAIELSGLQGGHSGVDIDKGRGNAMYMMAGVLRTLMDNGYRVHLGNFRGGTKNNAIPNSCIVNMMLAADNEAGLKNISEILYECQEALKRDYGELEPNADILWRTSTATTDIAYSFESSKKVVSLILGEPNGVQGMNEHIPGLVETSLNLGITSLQNNIFTAVYSLRSGNDADLTALEEKVERIAESVGATHTLSGEYPSWEYVQESPFRDGLAEIWREMYGSEPQICTIHAGVECGVLSAKKPGLDCVSIGPAMEGIHTTAERLDIESFKRVYDFVKKAVER